jgi:hypothetical protein
MTWVERMWVAESGMGDNRYIEAGVAMAYMLGLLIKIPGRRLSCKPYIELNTFYTTGIALYK